MNIGDANKKQIGKEIQLFVTAFFTLAFILLAVYIWKEDISVEYKINHEKFASYFSGLTMIVAILALFFAYSQILEMRAVNLPEIFPKDAEFIIYDKNDHFVPYLVIKNKELLNSEIDNHCDKIEIFNIGTGAARNVKVEWIYDLTEVADFNTGKYPVDLNWQTETEQYLFLSTGKSVKIEVPYFYFCCYGAENNKFRMGKASDESEGIIYRRPRLSLKISFQGPRFNPAPKLFSTTFDAVKYGIDGEFESHVSMKFSSIDSL